MNYKFSNTYKKKKKKNKKKKIINIKDYKINYKCSNN